MNKLKYFSLLIVLILGITSVNAQEAEANVAITLQRDPCFGSCPVYTVTIYDDGTVVYNGDNFVEVTGEQTSEIDPATVELMVAAFENAGYFEWDEAYTTQTVTDLPTVTTSVTRDGVTHTIVRYTGDSSAPIALPFLEQWIDLMASTQMWTGAQPDISTISNGTSTPIVTLQRTACFGMCPIYNVAMFEDGTVVYMGIANVSEIGVQVFDADPLAVTIIPQQAQAFGYFGWQDSYETQVMTDQATVITSIQWEDQFKRIVRYDGDPNAPVGLVWIEESIDRLVTELIG
jgi:hypothetical protein